ncbi:uncharacterized protein LOC142333644 isoform X1 [Lycorma delicatula]|uniref:uncharacterized protein LOC142333644 isoform X1 n=1 Tax=Lycorma delicatula TaxID=130591 RepID=UPI003F512129
MVYDNLIKLICNNNVDEVNELLIRDEVKIKSLMTNFKAYYLFYKVKSKEMFTVLLNYLESNNIFDISDILTSIINIAIMRGSGIDTIRRLIDKGGNINSTDMRGISPLLQSIISKRNVSFIKYIIETGANVNEICDGYKNTILHLAVKRFCVGDDLNTIKLLLDSGANVNSENRCGEIPLINAASTTDENLWFELLNRGSNIVESSKFQTENKVLFSALSKKNRSTKLIRRLITDGASVHALNGLCETPLVLALKNNYGKDCIVELIGNGANLKTNYIAECNTNPLLAALELRRDDDIISVLNDNGAVNAVGKYDESPLICAINNKYDGNTIRKLITRKTINKRDRYGCTPLMYALKNNDKNIIGILIDSEADVNAVDNEGKSCLLYAILYPNDEDIINYMIYKGADVNKLKNQDELPFSVQLLKNSNTNRYSAKIIPNREAVSSKTFLNYVIKLNTNKSIIFDIICNGADVNAVDECGRTPLIYAITNKCDHDIVVKLIDCGADVNLEDNEGEFPLKRAILSDCKELAKILINYGADINKQDKYGETILSNVLWKNSSKELVDILLESGADVNLSNNRGETALTVAIRGRYKFLNPDLEIITALIKKGANVNAVDKQGRTPLFFALSNECIGDDKIFRLLLDHGADLYVALDNLHEDDTPLLCAIGEDRNVEKAIEVLRYKEDIFEEDKRGNIFVATLVKLFKYKELALTLLRDRLDILKKDSQTINKIVGNAADAEFMDKLINLFGIDIDNVDDEGRTPLMYAVINRRDAALINTMIEKGAYPKRSDRELNTPLHFADSEDVLNTLIIYGDAEINAKNIFGETPFEYASHHCVFAETLKAYIKHLVLIFSEKSVRESNKYSEYDYHLNACEIESNKMKLTNIINNFSYYKFCCRLSKFDKNLILESKSLFVCNEKRIQELFPIYASMIIMKLKTYKLNAIKINLLKNLKKLIIENKYDSKENDILLRLGKLNISNGNCGNEYSCRKCDSVSLDFASLCRISKYLSCRHIINLFLVSM